MRVKKILIVDDDKEFLEELNETLVLSGYDVVAVNDASGVLDMVTKTRPDVILLDLKMPHKDGFQVADQIKHLQETSRIPIIAMTAFFKEDYLPLMNVCGIQKYLKKPFNPLELIVDIEAVLGEN